MKKVHCPWIEICIYPWSGVITWSEWTWQKSSYQTNSIRLSYNTYCPLPTGCSATSSVSGSCWSDPKWLISVSSSSLGGFRLSEIAKKNNKAKILMVFSSGNSTCLFCLELTSSMLWYHWSDQPTKVVTSGVGTWLQIVTIENTACFVLLEIEV